LEELPDVDVVTAGFPCTDLSQAGRTSGITGKESRLVSHLFRLLQKANPECVVVENVRNMLVLKNGTAMRYLVSNFENLGYTWAYRLLDSRFTGVPQRRQRVVFIASKTSDPRNILTGNTAAPDPNFYRCDAYGFYWTEGLRGLGWAQDAVPTLKGGSSLGIPSSPAIWLPEAPVGRAIVTPSIRHAEELQGFPADWTKPAETAAQSSLRWKLIGNAVTVGVARWIGQRLISASGNAPVGHRLPYSSKWPIAGYGRDGERYSVQVGMWPIVDTYTHLLDALKDGQLKPLSRRATAGFLERAGRSSLRFESRFLLALKEHESAMAEMA